MLGAGQIHVHFGGIKHWRIAAGLMNTEMQTVIGWTRHRSLLNVDLVRLSVSKPSKSVTEELGHESSCHGGGTTRAADASLTQL